MTPEEKHAIETESDEAFLARLTATSRRAKAEAEEAAKPQLVAAVSPKMAAAIAANPGSLRLSVKGEDETVVVDRPKRHAVIQPSERCDPLSYLILGGYGTIDGKLDGGEFVGGYRQKAGAVSDYHPFSALKGNRE